MEFRARLERPEGVGTWTYFTVPFDAEKEYGGRSQIKVRGTIDGVPYRGTLMPNGDGTHFMVVNKSIRDRIGVQSGGAVSVTMEPDTEAREVAVPADLAAALAGDESALTNFTRLSYSHRKEYVDWIEGAKREETRRARSEKALARLAAGKKLRD